MTQNAFTLLSHALSELWRILTSITVPGTNFSFAILGLFMLFVPIVLKFFVRLFGVGGASQISSTLNSASKAKGK